MHQPRKPRTDKNCAHPVLRNWETARVFLDLARSGSFRAASQALSISVNTLRRQIEELEIETGHKLFTRHADGLRMTTEGQQMLAAAKRMELAAFDLMRARAPDQSLRGEVRLSVTEGLAGFWIAPHLVEFQRDNPGLLVELQSMMRPADIMRLECDVGVQLDPPTNPDLRVVKIGRVHAIPFASSTYIARHGRPKDVTDLAGHRLVLQIAEQVDSLGFARMFPGISQVGLVSVRTNASSTHLGAIVSGAGIGILPTYISRIPALEPIDVGVRFSSDISLVYHPDLAKIPRIRLIIDWLVDVFSPKRFPAFSDEFIHPRDLPDDLGGLSLWGLH